MKLDTDLSTAASGSWRGVLGSFWALGFHPPVCAHRWASVACQMALSSDHLAQISRSAAYLASIDADRVQGLYDVTTYG